MIVRSVVAVSRTIASGAERVSRLVAAELGYRYVDDEIIVRAAERIGVPAAEVDRVEHTPEFIHRVLQTIGETLEPETDTAPDADFAAYRTLIEDTIREVASEGSVVIVAHAASIPLAGRPELLRVLVSASLEARVTRLAHHPAFTRRTAERALRASDRERASYLKRFYGVGREEPTMYDLIVNTDEIGVALASDLIVRAARG